MRMLTLQAKDNGWTTETNTILDKQLHNHNLHSNINHGQVHKR